MKNLKELKAKIKRVYKNHQEKDWDCYGASPMLWLKQSLRFAGQIPVNLIKSLDIVPENDGCMCFEWFRSHNHFIDISVQDDNLIYLYEIGDKDSYGTTHYDNRQWLIEMVKEFYKEFK